ncbi:phage major capsid protein, P2 family [Ottowia sp.]|uniref:phage major capsid protein, P2 family n=1 Tax=Ottowia sp. TaxID=1898956 RepID=UPI003A84A6E3
MYPETRQALNGFLTQVAKLNGVTSVAETFNVAPSVQQTLENRMQESSDFLKKINVIGVREQEGEKIGLGVTGPVASRTDTTNAERQTRDVSDLNNQRYRCEQTNYDTHLRYAKIDAWAKFPDFQVRLRNAIVQRQALDRIMIGFNGTSVAADTNLVTNPLLQDVNKGWLHNLRTDAPARHMAEVVSGSGQITVGASGDYKNLDALIYDAKYALIDPWYRDDPGLVAIMGSDLLHDKFFGLIDIDQSPTESLAANVILSQKRVGGLVPVTVPYFPANAVLITRLDNLSIYYQTGARRRHLIDNPKRDRIENFESSNDAYPVEDYGCAALIENITAA